MVSAPAEQGPASTVLEDRCQPVGPPSSLPLEVGSKGDAVVDLRRRLARLGFPSTEDDSGVFGPATQAAVLAFQRERGIRTDGICGRFTWAAIVEAGFELGDRLLYRRAPMLQGDDVAELQRRLSALGFDPGGVDGIFGDQTVVALAEFQRNVGLVPDGICGPSTLNELSRLRLRPGGGDLVTLVRERLSIGSRPRTLVGRRIAVGETGGFAVGVHALCRALSAAGAVPTPLHLPDPEEQAAAANVAAVDCYVGLRLEPEQAWARSFFYRGYRYESIVSRRLAELVQTRLPASLGLDDGGISGMALPELRGTQMPAVLIELGSPIQVVMRTVDLSAAVVEALSVWFNLDWD